MNNYEKLNEILMKIHIIAVHDMCVARNKNCTGCPFYQYHDTDSPNWCAINKPYEWSIKI